MKKLLVIGATSHRESINVSLARFAGSLVSESELNVLDLNEFEMPIYSQDREEADGIPEAAEKFVDQVKASDGIVISLAEHNGSYTAAFKNIFDWASRHQQKVWSDKPMLVMATSPGGRGGATVLDAAAATFPHLGGNVVATFSLPSFYDNFEDGSGITNAELKSSLGEAVAKFGETF